MDDRELYREIVARYARHMQNGRPMRCHASLEELDQLGDGEYARGDGKIIYNDSTAAEQAAHEFGDLDGETYETYPCPRSQTGHRHVRKMPSRGRREGNADEMRTPPVPTQRSCWSNGG